MNYNNEPNDFTFVKVALASLCFLIAFTSFLLAMINVLFIVPAILSGCTSYLGFYSLYLNKKEDEPTI